MVLHSAIKIKLPNQQRVTKSFVFNAFFAMALGEDGGMEWFQHVDKHAYLQDGLTGIHAYQKHFLAARVNELNKIFQRKRGGEKIAQRAFWASFFPSLAVIMEADERLGPVVITGQKRGWGQQSSRGQKKDRG